MFTSLPRLRKPGLFITATDTGVGKTVATCAIAWQLRRQGFARVGVSKPYATGCRKLREGLVSEDAEAIAHFSDCRQPLHVINPIRYAKPLAPAVAAEAAGDEPDLEEFVRCLRLLDEENDALLIEGVGGVMVPLSPSDPKATVLDLIAALDLPAVVVCRAGLGTLNHTAMTVTMLRQRGCRVAGLIMNGYTPDVSAPPAPASLGADAGDPSITGNRVWLQRMNDLPILATIPVCPASEVAAHRGLLPDAVLDAAGATWWPDVLAPAR